MLLAKIKSDLVQAQKDRDQEKIDTLRFLLGALKNVRIEKYPQGDDSSLTDEDVSLVLQKQVKTHKESVEMFKTGNRQDLVDKEEAQLLILQSYLPKQMGESEVTAKIQQIRASNPDADFGTMMKLSMAELKGQTDGNTVSKILREVLK